MAATWCSSPPARPMTEPFATLLVEATWARGRNLREYTVLFDPPVFAPEDAPPAPVAAPATGGGDRSGVGRAPGRRLPRRRARGAASRGRRRRRPRAPTSSATAIRCRPLRGSSPADRPDRSRDDRDLSRQSAGLRRQHQPASRRRRAAPAGRCRGCGRGSGRGRPEVRRQSAAWSRGPRRRGIWQRSAAAAGASGCCRR